ncbi:AAA family ATPase [Nannocystis pusilla]|uniref:AAA family ATPase n=1 Tax=Nannocystis pusilla TaxID=889268 RepID=A0A9X3IV72_9BACT|nr:serine/threonine-protein kinase [Nannocystis pusilla]MCY1004600.1 AAA family ATPase [Nannocystis pusilla]
MTHLSTEQRTVRVKGYHVTAKIDETAGSATYLARRDADGARVAMKVLHTEYTRMADIARFKHAYGLIKRIDSERVVKVLEVEEHGDGLVLITEYFSGDALCVTPRGELDVRAFLDAAIAMAEALADIHRRGLIHGDVRPPNIRLGEGGQVKLTGFGVDCDVTREKEEIYSPRVLSEVLPYTSPEQTGRMNRSVDYRTDMYSLGIVFYELLAGRRPFEATDPLELMHAHMAVRPVPPAELDPHIPQALCAITTKLLSKNAEDRYHSARGLVADLEECRRQWDGSGAIESFNPGQYDRRDLFEIRQKLYGREEDIRRLIEAFDDVLQGKRAIVLVSGYSGIGKSSLVQEILKPLAREKGYYISGKYDQHDRDTPYSAIVQAFDSLVRQLLRERGEDHEVAGRHPRGPREQRAGHLRRPPVPEAHARRAAAGPHARPGRGPEPLQPVLSNPWRSSPGTPIRSRCSSTTCNGWTRPASPSSRPSWRATPWSRCSFAAPIGTTK